MSRSPGYVAITPVRDEAENLLRLSESVLEQRVRPLEWILVDNGSSDATPTVISRLTREHSWIRTISTEPEIFATPGAPIVRAFHAGLAALQIEQPEVVVKLDADVSFSPDYFREILVEFRSHPVLGIAGGVCYERQGEEWRPTFATGDHVRGAVRAYRWECLQDVLPLEERMGWDGIDGLKANVFGWQTRTLDRLAFRHHRGVGARDGTRGRRWRALGEGAYFMGYRPWYLVARSLHHARRDIAALTMIRGYAAAASRRAPVYGDVAVRNHLRSQQTLRNLRRRIAEAHGKRVV